MLESEQNEHDVLEALGEYKCDAGMPVEDVPAIVSRKTLKGRWIAHKFNTVWAVGAGKCLEKQKSVVGHFAVECKSETYCWTKKLNRKDHGVGKCWVLLAAVQEEALLKNNKHSCVHLTN